MAVFQRAGGEAVGQAGPVDGHDPAEIAGIAAAIQPRNHRMFAGKLDRHNLSRPQRAALLVFRGLDGDFRDWAEIRQWAGGVAAQLTLTGFPQR